jgi:hypothetical protein
MNIYEPHWTYPNESKILTAKDSVKKIIGFQIESTGFSLLTSVGLTSILH